MDEYPVGFDEGYDEWVRLYGLDEIPDLEEMERNVGEP